MLKHKTAKAKMPENEILYGITKIPASKRGTTKFDLSATIKLKL
jgi:hypothetical protein